MLNIDKYFLYSFILFSILFSSFIIENIDAQEVQLREGDKIIIELIDYTKLNGTFVRMDSVSIIYVQSGRKLLYKTDEKIVKKEKIKQIYNEKGLIIYAAPEQLNNDDYPKLEALIGFSRFLYYSLGKDFEAGLVGFSISGGGNIKKWLSLELKLNFFSNYVGFTQLFLNINGYHKKHRFFTGLGIGGVGYWFAPTEPMYSIGGGFKLYSSNYCTLRIGAYDYIERSRYKNKHNILAEIGIAFSK